MHDQLSNRQHESIADAKNAIDHSPPAIDPPAGRAAGSLAEAAAEPAKNPVAVELGRRGGLKGGRARAEQLSPERRRAIALKAAQSRWGARAGAPELPGPLDGTPTVAGPAPTARAATDPTEPAPAAAADPESARRQQPNRQQPNLTEWQALANLPGSDSQAHLRLTDWRRRIADLYAEVRRRAQDDPEEAWRLWGAVRELLYRRHPLSPVPAAQRASFAPRHFPYDPSLRFEAPVRVDGHGRGHTVGGPSNTVVLPNSGTEMLAFERVGRVDVPIDGISRRLSLFWITGYAGGLFLPFRDATNGTETYGAGRYLLDTAKGADLGSGTAAGTIVLDFNFAFQPSCAFDSRWSCPLAPPENRLDAPIRTGERMP